MMFRKGTEGSGTERISFSERNGFFFWTERNGTQPPNVNPDPKNGVVTKTFAPKFRSEPSDREVHSSHGDYFRDHACIYVSQRFSAEPREPANCVNRQNAQTEPDLRTAPALKTEF